ncbi:CCA tRNA nucleotidyltransferase [Oleispirillum naphthae]|uniref:CCA tRNA nucleotidyltransferase n=1 Tax=Oleispirillum naphthae TaxID=2838853 RepID=UPI0030823351
MDPVGQIAPQDWLVHPDTRAVMAALSARGAAARFAGGCVRDSLLGLPVHDVDIAVDCPPAETMSLLAAAGIRAVPTGFAHGTVTAVTPSRAFEITSLRRDVETDGRHAVVAFTGDWAADAARRDLTINALYADAGGAVYDPCDGLADLGARRVRFVGDAERRIAEDGLRILRFFRFFGRYGAPPADAAALAACRKLAPMLDALSGERVWAEMRRILAGPDPGEVLLLMRGEGVAERLMPGALEPGRLRVLAWLETRGLKVPEVEPSAVRRLAALIAGEDAEADCARAGALAAAWRFSNAERDRLLGALAPLPEPVCVAMPRAAARRMLHRLGAERWRDRVLVAWAGYRHRHGARGPLPGARGSAAWEALLRLPESDAVPEFPVSGADVLALGAEPGPEVGAALRRLEAEWAAGDFALGRAALLARLAEIVGGG